MANRLLALPQPILQTIVDLALHDIVDLALHDDDDDADFTCAPQGAMAQLRLTCRDLKAACGPLHDFLAKHWAKQDEYDTMCFMDRAVVLGTLQDVQKLIAAGVTAIHSLHAACGKGSPDVVEYLVDLYGQHVDEQQHCLLNAAEHGNIAAVKVLAPHFCGTNVYTHAMEGAVRHGHLAAVQELMAADECQHHYDRLLDVAVQYDSRAVLKLLLDAGANPGGLYYNPLMSAAREGRLEVCEMLLAAGACVAADSNGAIKAAAAAGQTQAVAMLLHAGARADHGTLINGSRSGIAALVRLLLSTGKYTDDQKCSAYVEAMKRGHTSVMRALAAYIEDKDKLQSAHNKQSAEREAAAAFAATHRHTRSKGAISPPAHCQIH